MKQITLSEAVVKALEPEQKVYMIIPVTPLTMIEELAAAAGFCCKDEKDGEPVTEVTEVTRPVTEVTAEEPPKQEEAPKPEKKRGKQIDHGRIVAEYKAGRSIGWIADDVGCSEQTVVNHLIREGIYKTGRAQENKA